MAKDESALLRSLFTGVDDGDRQHLVDLLNIDREDSGARLTPRRGSGREQDRDWDDPHASYDGQGAHSALSLQDW